MIYNIYNGKQEIHTKQQENEMHSKDQDRKEQQKYKSIVPRKKFLLLWLNIAIHGQITFSFNS